MRAISTVVRVAASASGTRSRSAAATAAWYVAYLVPSFSNVSYVCDSRLSCSGCSGACARYHTRIARGLHCFTAIVHSSAAFLEVASTGRTLSSLFTHDCMGARQNRASCTEPQPPPEEH